MDGHRKDAGRAVPNDDGAALPFVLACGIHAVVGLATGVGIVQLVLLGSRHGAAWIVGLCVIVGWDAYRIAWRVVDAIARGGGFLRGDGVGDELRADCHRVAVAIPVGFLLNDILSWLVETRAFDHLPAI